MTDYSDFHDSPLEKQRASRSKGNAYVLVAGLQAPKEPLRLASGVTLLPLVQFEPADITSIAFESGYGGMLLPMAKACSCEIESALDATDSPALDSVGRALFASRLLTVMGFTRHLPVAAASCSWDRIRELMGEAEVRASELIGPPPPGLTQADRAVWQVKQMSLKREDPVVARALNWTPPRLTSSRARQAPLSGDDYTELAEVFAALRTFHDDEVFQRALAAADDWRLLLDRPTAIARIWTGIEALIPAMGETKFRFSAYAASLLVDRGRKRQEVASALRRLYDNRSDVVHGRRIKSGKDQEILDDSFDVLRQLLRRIIRRGSRPKESEDFDRLLFE